MHVTHIRWSPAGFNFVLADMPRREFGYPIQ